MWARLLSPSPKAKIHDPGTKKKDKKQNFLNLIQAHEEQIKNLETKL